MSYRKLDEHGKPIPKNGRTRRLPAERLERGRTLFHYQIKAAIKQANGKYRYLLRHVWLPDDIAAADFEQSLRHRPSVTAITWEDAFRKWIEANRRRFSEGHIRNAETTMKRWYEAFGVNSTIEGTGLAEFSAWIGSEAKKGAGRGAQLKRGHLLAIARWCRKQGLITAIPFEHAQQPLSREKKVPPATLEEFRTIAKLLPEHLSLLWQLLAYTGMRLGAACALLEADITREEFTVLTKGRKRVTYPVTAPIQKIFSRARKWKAERGITCPALFCNLAGKPWTSTTYGRHIKNLCDRKDNSLGNVTPHQLRHLAGTIMGEKNLSINFIMAGLGHADSKSTHRYVDKTAGMRAVAMKALIQNLSKNDTQKPLADVILSERELAKMSRGVRKKCPCCGHKLLIKQKIKPQTL